MPNSGGIGLTGYRYRTDTASYLRGASSLTTQLVEVMMSLSIEDFGRLLAAKRGARGVRAGALEAGVTHSTFSRVENGHMPDLKPFAKLCKWLKRDPREFLGMEIAEAVPRQTRAVVHFKKKKTVQMETAKALGELILAAQRAVRTAEEQVGR